MRNFFMEKSWKIIQVSLLVFFFLTAAGIVVSVLYGRTHNTYKGAPAKKEATDSPGGDKGGFHCLGYTWSGIDMMW
jgi:hypothetical protein